MMQALCEAGAQWCKSRARNSSRTTATLARCNQCSLLKLAHFLLLNSRGLAPSEWALASWKSQRFNFRDESQNVLSIATVRLQMRTHLNRDSKFRGQYLAGAAVSRWRTLFLRTETDHSGTLLIWLLPESGEAT